MTSPQGLAPGMDIGEGPEHMTEIQAEISVRPSWSRSLLTKARQTIRCQSRHHRHEGSVELHVVSPVHAPL